MRRLLALLTIIILAASTFLSLLVPGTGVEAAPVYDEGGGVDLIVFDIWPEDEEFEDAQDEINYTGALDGLEGHAGFGWYDAWLTLKAECGGGECAPRNIYITVEITAAFESPSYEVPVLKIGYGAYHGGEEPEHREQGFACESRRIDHGIWPDSSEGECEAEFTDIIEGEDIPWDDPDAQFGAAWGLDNVEATWDIEWSVTFSTSPPTGCEDNYLPGAKFATITLGATNSAGVAINMLPGWPKPGAWVMAKVASGYWQNGGTGVHRFDLAIQRLPVTAWSSLAGYTYTGCTDTSAHAYYFQVSAVAAHRLRVNDTSTFETNTGTLTIELYLISSYTPTGSQCEGLYSKGSIIESNTVLANSSWGVPIGTGISADVPFSLGGEGATPGSRRYLWLETTGAYWNGSNYSSRASIRDGVTLFDIAAWPEVVCSTQMDPMGSYRIIFPYTQKIKDHLAKFLASAFDEYWARNSGTLGYSLYFTDYLVDGDDTDPGDPPLPEGCPNYSHSPTGTTYPLLGANRKGNSLTLTGGTIYAIESSGGPWTNDGVNAYDVGISDDSGLTWYDWYAYPGLLCAKEIDSNHYLIYFKAIAGRKYRIRAEDATEIYGDNGSSINAILYGATGMDSDWTPCSTDYIASQVMIPSDQRTIPAQNSEGVSFQQYLTAGETYGIEITDEAAWHPSLTPLLDRYTAEVTDDGGATWQSMPYADFAICVVYVSEDLEADVARFRIYFIADGDYRIRVKGGGIWASNLGYIRYRLYHVTQADYPVPDPDPGDSQSPLPQNAACDGVINQPAGLIEWESISLGPIDFGELGEISIPLISFPVPLLGDWIEYGRASIQHYLAFCLEHVEAVKTIPQKFNSCEPFGTITEIMNAIDSVNDKVQSLETSGGEQSFYPYDPVWNSGTGGEGTPADENQWSGIIPIIGDNSPWAGGPIVWEGAGGGEDDTAAYVAYCIDIYSGQLKNLTTGMCNTVALARKLGYIWIVLQVVVDAGALIALIKYIKGAWIDTGAAG